MESSSMATTHFHSTVPRIGIHALGTADNPPSPTLTNPDMILPMSLNTRDLSPSTITNSPSMSRKSLDPLSPASAFSDNLSQPENESQTELGVATAIQMPTRFKANPPADVTPNYRSYTHGAPLSDIGEEETTPRSRFSRKSRSPSPQQPPSPTPLITAGHTLRHKKRWSNRSSSSNDSVGNWEDFDSSKMMNSRLAADVAKATEDDDMDGFGSKRNSSAGIIPEDEMALLNERAERILENARKRLTHMEDNLSKARHSIVLSSPRSSPSMGDVHQPAGGLYRSISLAGASQRKSRSIYPVVKPITPTHTRGTSENNISPDLRRLVMVPEGRSASALDFVSSHDMSPRQIHSSPATRFTSNSPASTYSYNSPLRILQEEDGSSSTNRTSPENTGPRGLGINHMATVSKDHISPVENSSPTPLARSASAASTRSTKEIREQLSGLRTRIADLKEKAQADSVRRRTHQTRTPSPFTNSQAPELWYTSAPEYTEGGSPFNTNAGMGWSPTHENHQTFDVQRTPITPHTTNYLKTEPNSAKNSPFTPGGRTDMNTPNLHKRSRDPIREIPAEEGSIIQESLYEDAAQEMDDDPDQVAASEEEQIYLNEVLEESLHDIEPDVPEIPVQFVTGDGEAERHEDRLDAFDYENMFLHSAMGNYTGVGTRSRSNSQSEASSVSTRRAEQQTPTQELEQVNEDEQAESDDTTVEEGETLIHEPGIETATLRTPKGLIAPPKPWMKSGRTNSMDSTSSMNTFATATEGEYDMQEEEEEDEDETPREILEWGGDGGFPQPPTISPRIDIAGAWPTPTSTLRGITPQIQPPMTTNGIVLTNGSMRDSGIPTPPIQTPDNITPRGSSETARTANTEILMESLIKLVDPDFQVPEGKTVFSEVDKDLVLRLLRSVGGVCNEILLTESKGEIRAAKVLRRRLDSARRELEGGED